MARKNKEMQCSIIYNSIQLKSKSLTAGYFLLEFVIYIAASIILGSALFVLLSGVYKVMPKNINRVNEFTKLILSSDRLAQDILANNFSINNIDKNLLQLQTEQGNIKWFVHNERLVRQFIPLKNSQKNINNKNIAIVDTDVKAFYYLLDIKNNELFGIYYKISNANNYVENYIAIRARKKA